MNFQLSGQDEIDMGSTMLSRMATRVKKAATDPDVIEAVQNGPAGAAVFSVLPAGAKTILRQGAAILDQTKKDITSAVSKRAAGQVNTNMKMAGLAALGILGLGAGAYALSKRKS